MEEVSIKAGSFADVFNDMKDPWDETQHCSQVSIGNNTQYKLAGMVGIGICT